MPNLKDKVAIVTGASRGIGRACALELATAGANIVVNYHHSKDKAAEVVSEINKFDGEALAVQADISKKEDCLKLIDEAISAYGKVDILINNAAIHVEVPFDKLDDDLWDQIMENNLKSIYRLSVLAGRKMKEQGSGVIVNISSIAAMFPRATNFVYATSKGAIISLTRGLAVALAPDVRVNAVAPGRIETDMSSLSDTEDPQKREKVKATNLRKRIGQPEDIANVVKFLVSDESDWITGHTILADGGSSIVTEV